MYSADGTQSPHQAAVGAEAAAELRSQRLQALRCHPTLAAFSDQELDWIIGTVEMPEHRLDWFARAPDVAVSEMQQMVARRT